MSTATRTKEGLDLGVAELRHLLQSIPQELYDQIYDAVFTAPACMRNLTNPRIQYARHEPEIDWRKVSQQRKARRRLLNPLHVSSSTRAMYAPSFYAGHFQFDTCWETNYPSRRPLREIMDEPYGKWLKLIPEQHLHLVKSITISAEQTTVLWDRRLGLERHISHSYARLQGDISMRIGQAIGEKVFLKIGSTVYYDDGTTGEPIWPYRSAGVIVNPKFRSYNGKLAKSIGY